MKIGSLILVISIAFASCKQSPEQENLSSRAKLSGLIYVWNFEQASSENDLPYDMIFAVLDSAEAMSHHMETRIFVRKTLPKSDVKELLEELASIGGSYSESRQMQPYLPEVFSEWPQSGLTYFMEDAPTRYYTDDLVPPDAHAALTDFFTRNFDSDESGLTRQR